MVCFIVVKTHTHTHTQHHQPVNVYIKVMVRIQLFGELGSHSVRTFQCSFVSHRVSRNSLVREVTDRTEHHRFGMKTTYGVFLVELSTVENCTAVEHGLD
jgi:hypothetical protein